MSEVVLRLPIPPSALGPNGRMHYRPRTALKKAYAEQVWIVAYSEMNAPEDGPWRTADVRYDWHSTHQVDADNAIGRMKAALDVLQGGYIENDREVCLSYQWHKAATKKAECVIVTVTKR